ncbi:MAG: hypothetical protein R2800_06640 [Flavipsychrobacter sp.]
MKKDIQEQRIEDILNSIDGVQRAAAPDTLFDAIEQRIDNNTKRIIPLRTVVAVAASILLLLSVNVYLIMNTTKEQSLSKGDMNSVIKYYELEEQRVNIGI